MIPIFKYELEEKSIAEQLENSGSIAYTVDCKKKELTDEVIEAVQKSEATNKNQPDLFYLESILVSTNWNSNDDVFLPSETWAARHTPVDKPINIGHNEADIIGHMTNAYVQDFEGRAVADDISDGSIPKGFDIVVGGVIYTKWSKAELHERIQNLVDGIAEGTEKVSMEVLFNNFDYAIKKPNEETYSVIARNDETSYLTKHLRIYGGQGVYNNYQIGRVLKNLVFSGKGTTPNPANPRSIITNYNFTGESFADTSKIFGSESKMADTQTVTKAEFDSLKAELEAQKAKSETERTKREAELESTIANLKSELEQTKADLEASKSFSTETQSKVADLESKIEAQAAKMKEKEDEVDKMKKEKSKADRISKLVDIGLERNEAEEVYTKFASASDEMFDSIVELKSQAKKPYEKDEEEEDNSKGKEAEAELDNSEDEANAGLNQDTETDDDKLMKSAASWIGGLYDVEDDSK